jgi:hypothetical protein
MPEGGYRSPRHRSRGGEGPAHIAAHHGVSVAALLELNPCVSSDTILGEDDIVVLPAAHGLEGSIAAISDRRGHPGLLIYSVGDGSSKMLESAQCSWASVAALSPDGQSVAVQGTDGRIHVTDVCTGSDRVITEPLAGFVTPKWSAGCDWIMYEHDGHVHVVGAASPLRGPACPGRFAAWLGDGYRMIHTDLGDVIIRDMVDGGQVPLASEPEPIWGLAAAAYGESVAYLASEGENVVLCTVDVVTGDRWRVNVDRRVWPWSLAWAPNGKMIAYCVGAKHVDGGQVVRVVVFEPGYDGEVHETEIIGDPRFTGLAWSPDSRAVAVAARIERRGQYGVYAIEPGIGMFQLTGIGNCVVPDWGREAD